MVFDPARGVFLKPKLYNMHSMLISFDNCLDPEYIEEQFAIRSARFTGTFCMIRIPSESKQIIFKIVTDFLADIYYAGMIGYHIEQQQKNQ